VTDKRQDAAPRRVTSELLDQVVAHCDEVLASKPDDVIGADVREIRAQARRALRVLARRQAAQDRRLAAAMGAELRRLAEGEPPDG